MRPSSGKERAGNLLSRDSLLVVGEVDVGAELDVLEGAFPPPQQAERGKQRVSERRGWGGGAGVQRCLEVAEKTHLSASVSISFFFSFSSCQRKSNARI